MTPARADDPTGVSILLGSSDPEHLRAFYEDLFQRRSEDGRLDLAGVSMLFRARDDVAARAAEPGRVVLTFQVEDLAGYVQRAADAGAVGIRPPESHEDGLASSFEDPDGNLVRVIELDGAQRTRQRLQRAGVTDQPLVLDPADAVLLTVDLMQRIADQELAPYSGPHVVAQSRALALAMRHAGSPVVHIRTDRPGQTSQPPGSDFVPGLVEEGDHCLVKTSIGAFATSDLHQLLQEQAVRTIILAGIATNLGVESTARTASDLGYELFFVEDAMTGLTSHEHEGALIHTFLRLGTICTTADALTALGRTV